MRVDNKSHRKSKNQQIRIRLMCETMLGGVSNSTVYRWIKKEGFPKPIKLSSSCSVWNVQAVQAWIDSRNQETEVA